MNNSGNSELPRRRFMRQLLVLGGATGAGVMLAGQVQAQSTPAGPGNAESTTQHKGYRLTEHIRTYYEKAQI